MKRSQDYIVTDAETGELIEKHHVVVLDDDDMVISKAQREFAKKKRERYQDGTDFVWLKFEYGNPLSLNISKANLARLVYLGTFCGEDGLLLPNQWIHAKFDLNKNQQTDFWKETTDNGLLRKVGSATYINIAVISKGEITTDSDYIRIFTGTYRRLYEATHTQTEQNHLYYLLQMIPFLNRQTNILAYNRKEQDRACVANMTFSDYCQRVGYDKSHMAKLRRQLSTFRIDGELAVGFFDDLSELVEKGKYVILNPKLCFGGDRTLGSYVDACTLFEAEKASMAE